MDIIVDNKENSVTTKLDEGTNKGNKRANNNSTISANNQSSYLLQEYQSINFDKYQYFTITAARPIRCVLLYIFGPLNYK